MESVKLFDAEYRLLSLIWANEPIKSTDLSKLCLSHLGWKKSTTYTMLKKLCKRKILVNHDSVVSSLLKEDTYQSMESLNIVNKTFDGSLPKFITAFLNQKSISAQELIELELIIQEAIK